MTARIAKLTFSGLCNVNDHIILSVAELLKKSHVVAVPTDTIYGLAGLAQDNWAVRTIYSIKSRDIRKPLAICVSDICEITRWAIVTVSRALLEDLLPGPVTLVFERTQELNPNLNPESNLVGIRIPNNSFLRKVVRTIGEPVALTSANLTNANSALSIDEFKDLWPHLRLVVDGGRLSDSEETRYGSTVVDLSVVGHYRIIRKGCAYQETVDVLAKRHNLLPIS